MRGQEVPTLAKGAVLPLFVDEPVYEGFSSPPYPWSQEWLIFIVDLREDPQQPGYGDLAVQRYRPK